MTDTPQMVDLNAVTSVLDRAIRVYGERMRATKNRTERRDWQSMLFASVDIRDAVLKSVVETHGSVTTHGQ